MKASDFIHPKRKPKRKKKKKERRENAESGNYSETKSSQGLNSVHHHFQTQADDLLDYVRARISRRD